MFPDDPNSIPLTLAELDDLSNIASPAVIVIVLSYVVAGLIGVVIAVLCCIIMGIFRFFG